MKSYIKHRDFLSLLLTSKRRRRNSLLDTATREEVNSVVELIYNILRGAFDLTTKEQAKLYKHKAYLRALIKKKISASKKKEILKQRGGSLFPLLVPLLSGLVGGLFRAQR